MPLRSWGPGHRGQVLEAGQMREGCSSDANHLPYIPQPRIGRFDGGPSGPRAADWDHPERKGNGVLESKGYPEGSASLPLGWLLCKHEVIKELSAYPGDFLRAGPMGLLELASWWPRVGWSEWDLRPRTFYFTFFFSTPSAFGAPSLESAFRPTGARSCSE